MILYSPIDKTSSTPHSCLTACIRFISFGITLLGAGAWKLHCSRSAVFKFVSGMLFVIYMSHCGHDTIILLCMDMYMYVVFRVGDGNEERDRYPCGYAWKNT